MSGGGAFLKPWQALEIFETPLAPPSVPKPLSRSLRKTQAASNRFVQLTHTKRFESDRTKCNETLMSRYTHRRPGRKPYCWTSSTASRGVRKSLVSTGTNKKSPCCANTEGRERCFSNVGEKIQDPATVREWKLASTLLLRDA